MMLENSHRVQGCWVLVLAPRLGREPRFQRDMSVLNTRMATATVAKRYALVISCKTAINKAMALPAPGYRTHGLARGERIFMQHGGGCCRSLMASGVAVECCILIDKTFVT